MNRSSSLIINLIIICALAAAGIWYILHKSPVSQVDDYQKGEMPKPSYGRSTSIFSSKSDDEDPDGVSITGKKGKYDEVRIGRETQ